MAFSIVKHFKKKSRFALSDSVLFVLWGFLGRIPFSLSEQNTQCRQKSLIPMNTSKVHLSL